MITTAIPPDLVVAAMELNRNYGTLYAWRFLAHKGMEADRIYLLLKDAIGPEPSQPNNNELWQMIADAG